MAAGDEWKRRIAPGGSVGAMAQRMRDLKASQDQLSTRTPLRSAVISEGGLEIRDGGDLRVVGENGETVRLGDGRIEMSNVPAEKPGYLASGIGVHPDVPGPAAVLVPPETVPTPEGETPATLVLGGRTDDYAGAAILYSPARADVMGVDYAEVMSLNEVFIGSLGGPTSHTILGSTGDTTIGGDGVTRLGGEGGLLLQAGGTTTSPANTYISGSGADVELRQVSSSIRYKVDVEGHHTDQAALLAIEPRSWRDKAEVAEDPETTARYVGFIAEELHDLGLTEYVVYNPDGSAESVAYDRLTVGLIDALKTKDGQVRWLAEKVAALTGETMPDFTPAPTPGVRATRPVPPAPTIDEETT